MTNSEALMSLDNPLLLLQRRMNDQYRLCQHTLNTIVSSCEPSEIVQRATKQDQSAFEYIQEIKQYNMYSLEQGVSMYKQSASYRGTIYLF